MQALTARKNKIVLADYNYRRDIETRVLLSHLTVDSVNALREILDGSLKTTVSHVADALDITPQEVLPHLEKLSPTKLFTRQGDHIIVDKEMRKYLESQIDKFDPDYELGMEYLQTLLAKVPMHAIPNWYALSRASDHVFSAIIEKHLLTPQIYQRYLDELVIDFPDAVNVARDVMKAPNFMLTASDVMEKYKMSHEDFEECVLHLEYNLACCHGYQQIGDTFEEVITPFYEWSEYLTYLMETVPDTISSTDRIRRDYRDDFGFLKHITENVEALQNPPKKILSQMQLLHLIEETDEGFVPTKRADYWLELPLQEQAATLYRQILHTTYKDKVFNDNDLRQTQKSLKRVTKAGWIYFEDFLKGFTLPLGSAEPTTLKNRGKRWRYTRPTIAEKEIEFIQNAIFDTFLQVGIVATGTHDGKLCFCVTPFGRMSTED